jgi:alpha-galactosidase
MPMCSILLKDPACPFEVALFYKQYFRENVIEQWAAIKPAEKGNVLLQKMASANLYIPGKSFWLRQCHGDNVCR